MVPDFKERVVKVFSSMKNVGSLQLLHKKIYDSIKGQKKEKIAARGLCSFKYFAWSVKLPCNLAFARLATNFG